MVTRRSILKGLAAFAAGGVGLAGYAFGIEPMWRLRVQRYAFTPPRWPKGLRLTATLIADIHAGEPQMSAARIREIVATANGLAPDLHLLLGDYAAGHKWVTRPVHSDEWSAALGGLRAPLGVHAILGNHDWWDDHSAQRAGKGPVVGRTALEKNGIAVYENDAVRLVKNDEPFWIAGLGDQLALFERRFRRNEASSNDAEQWPVAAGNGATFAKASSVSGRFGRRILGVDDLPGTLAKVTDDAPVILMAHEPDIFPSVPDRVAVTLSGHTHGGQVRLLGYSPIVPSRYGRRYAYGHVVEHRDGSDGAGRNLIVSGGLGCSILPVRFGMPPEIVLLELGARS